MFNSHKYSKSNEVIDTKKTKTFADHSARNKPSCLKSEIADNSNSGKQTWLKDRDGYALEQKFSSNQKSGMNMKGAIDNKLISL